MRGSKRLVVEGNNGLIIQLNPAPARQSECLLALLGADNSVTSDERLWSLWALPDYSLFIRLTSAG